MGIQGRGGGWIEQGGVLCCGQIGGRYLYLWYLYMHMVPWKLDVELVSFVF